MYIFRRLLKANVCNHVFSICVESGSSSLIVNTVVLQELNLPF